MKSYHGYLRHFHPGFAIPAHRVQLSRVDAMTMWGLGLARSNISQWQEILALYVIPYQSFVEEILFDDWDTRLILANAEKRDPPSCFSLNFFGLLRRVFSY